MKGKLIFVGRVVARVSCVLFGLGTLLFMIPASALDQSDLDALAAQCQTQVAQQQPSLAGEDADTAVQQCLLTAGDVDPATEFLQRTRVSRTSKLRGQLRSGNK